MDDKTKILEEFKRRINKLKEYNNLYYNHDNPKISDSKYDNFKKEVSEFENKYDFS